MKLLFVAVASSLLLAAISTGITFRFLIDAPVIAFIVTLVLMFIVAVVNARTALRTITGAAPAAAASSGPKAQGNRGNRNDRGGNDRNRGSRNQDKPRERKPRDDDQPAGKPGAPIQHEGKPVTGDYESGNVKWFSRSKGFGFIVRPNGEEIFVHYRSVRSGEDGRRPNLRDGQDVKYIVTDHDKGLQAEDVSAA
ncbi:MAG: cold shock domain-containing protein [Pseudomonadaceae bacterium]|nr:cold shock domain-containing protein [Pseudomonadaceae bacterium]